MARPCRHRERSVGPAAGRSSFTYRKARSATARGPPDGPAHLGTDSRPTTPVRSRGNPIARHRIVRSRRRWDGSPATAVTNAAKRLILWEFPVDTSHLREHLSKVAAVRRCGDQQPNYETWAVAASVVRPRKARKEHREQMKPSAVTETAWAPQPGFRPTLAAHHSVRGSPDGGERCRPTSPSSIDFCVAVAGRLSAACLEWMLARVRPSTRLDPFRD